MAIQMVNIDISTIHTKHNGHTRFQNLWINKKNLQLTLQTGCKVIIDALIEHVYIFLSDLPGNRTPHLHVVHMC